MGRLPRPLLAALLAFGLVAATAACGGDDGGSDTSASDGSTSEATSPTSPDDRPDCTAAPLAERAAAVLIVGIDDDTTADGALAREVTSIGVGGVEVRQPNVVDAAQLRALVDGLRAQSARKLLVAADEEGGRVSRLRSVLGSTASARTLGNQPLDAIRAEAARRGQAMREVGIDLVLGPVADADGGPANGSIGDRSFSADIVTAGERAGAFAAGLTDAGMLSSVKHFPGQGGVADDSHAGTVTSPYTAAQVEDAARAFLPAVEAGAGAVMMSHVTYEAVGPLPASVEPAMYELLRSLGFDGVAMTDALGMGAIVQRWPIPQAAVVALTAGADVVLVNQGQEAVGMRDAIVAAVTDGSLPEARLDEAVGRVLRWRGEDPASMVCPN
ncbi:MAG: hypothetical protein M3Z03_09860 [Actinomycetota bacterium]|nr:hypothetical protein [Actinomycetota bacterium]